MDDSNKLTRLQSDFLVAWFERSGDFFLTGGGALSGFYGLPRTIDWERFQVPGLVRIGILVALVQSPGF